jgi:putative endonuclease
VHTKQETGRYGEQVAADYLRQQGFVVIARNVRTPFGELDLIAHDQDILVFVEVKLRRSRRFGKPEEALTWRKRMHLANAIASYLNDDHVTGPYRLDVIALEERNGRRTIRHIKGIGG